MKLKLNLFLFPILLVILLNSSTLAQYQFKVDQKAACTEVKSQDNTGTCWSFATSSFIESEILKTKNTPINISEMFIVKNIYKDKARNYVLRQGKANFGQGSLAHDLIKGLEEYGVEPESVYSGKNTLEKFNHNEMEAALKGFLDGVVSTGHPSIFWSQAFSSILDAYMGKEETSFEVGGKSYTPKSYAEYLGIKQSNYEGFTSFTHHPFESDFILEIPDNYSNGSYHNVSLDQLVKITNNALEKGYTIAWDGDVSEKSFSAKNGIAILPEEPNREDLWTTPGKEHAVDQDNRQREFESLATTDDHLMHIVGFAHDQNGTKYYIVKNSWGEISEYKGFLFMSEAYFKMKTVSIYVNKAAL